MVSSNWVDWQKVTFDEAFTDITAKATKVDQSEFLHSGKFPIIDQGQNFIAGYTDNDELVWGDDLPVVIFGDHTRILKYIDFPFVLGADGTKVLKPNKDILPLFAYYQLLSFDIPSAGYSRHFKFLKDYKFQYPPLTEQKRIASLLARADRLRRLRRTARDLGDELLQSVFLEMFGDPIENSGNWDREPLIDVINPNRPITYGILMPGENLPNGVPYVRVVDIRNGKIDVENVRRTSDAIDKQYKRSRLLPEDLLLTIRGQVGRLAIVPQQLSGANITQDTARLAPIKSKCNVYFLYGYFLMPSVQKLMQSLTRGVAVTGINLGDVKELPIPLPPLSKQEEFAGVVARVEGLRGRMGESTRQVEGLFESLLSQSFGGDA